MPECYNKKILESRHKDKQKRYLIKVPCSRCLNCIKNKQLELSLRMRLESYYYNYVLNFVLTYDSEHIELINENQNIDTELFIVRNFDRVKDLFNNKKLSLHDYNQYEIRYYNILDSLATLRVRHINNLLDYLRKNIKRKKLNIDYKYLLSAEYPKPIRRENKIILRGRPHYHGIFLTNSKSELKELIKIISSAWSYGNVNYWNGVETIINLNVNELDLTKNSKLEKRLINCVVENSENKENDIKRICEYIDKDYLNEYILANQNQASIYYASKYAYKYLEYKKDYDNRDKTEIIKSSKDIQNKKENMFIKYSKSLAKRYLYDNYETLIEKFYIETNDRTGNIYKNKIPNYFIAHSKKYIDKRLYYKSLEVLNEYEYDNIKKLQKDYNDRELFKDYYFNNQARYIVNYSSLKTQKIENIDNIRSLQRRFNEEAKERMFKNKNNREF